MRNRGHVSECLFFFFFFLFFSFRLWKFQQSHRSGLEATAGLRRWEIGDIASHIGQVYYQYYLRTAERSYLAESAVFYDAVQQRKYFQELTNSSSIDDWRRLLRYYARFVMVGLLQQHYDKVSSVSSDLHKWVQQYVSNLSPPDAQEWLAVVRELRVFCHAVLPASPVCVILPGELAANRPPAGEVVPPVVLQQCVLVGCQTHQIKFSELTLDFLRMMRAVERRESSVEASPSGRANLASSTQSISLGVLSPAASGVSSLRTNPTKHLLYRPSLGSVSTHLHGTVKELTGNGAMLVYISADAYLGKGADPLWSGGALMCGTTPAATQSKNASSSFPPLDASANALCPGDLVPLTRHPLLLICEGDCSVQFGALSSPFGAPFVSLLAPEKYPPGMERTRSVVSPTFVMDQGFGAANDGASDCFGNLFTLFLTDAVTALVRLGKVASAGWSEQKAAKCKEVVTACLEFSTAALQRMPAPWGSFCADLFSGLFIAKFALCVAVFSRHKNIPRSSQYVPSSSPPLPIEALPSAALFKAMLVEFGIEASFDEM